MWNLFSGKSNGRNDDAPTTRRKEDQRSTRRRTDSKTSPTTAQKPSRGDDRDRGFNPTSTSYSSTSRSPYPGGASASIASSYATASSKQADESVLPHRLERNSSLAQQIPKARLDGDECDSIEGRLNKSESRRRERSSSRDRIRDRKDRSRSRDRDERKKAGKEMREKRGKDQRKDQGKDRGLSRSESGFGEYQGTSRAGVTSTESTGSFNAQVGNSGFTQFPGQYEGGMPGFSPEVPHPSEGMSAHVQDQFPGQFPSESTAPYRPPLAASEGGPGLAAEYYGDAGESVASQPGVRPQPPSVIVGAEPHLHAASAIAAPPPEPSASGSVGAAASFFSTTDDFKPSASRPPKSRKPTNSGQTQKIGGLTGPAALAAGAAIAYTTEGGSESKYHHDSTMSSNDIKYQQSSQGPIYSVHPIAPLPQDSSYHSASAPVIPTLGAAAVGTAAAYMMDSHNAPQYQGPVNSHSLGGTTNENQPLTSQRPSSQVHEVSFSESSHLPDKSYRPPQPSNAPLYAVGAIGTAGLTATAYNRTHQSSAQASYSTQLHPSTTLAQRHQHSGPLEKFVEFWTDPDGVAEFEAYSEYIGVCRYCFAPGSTPRDAPRKHNYRRRGSNERYGSSIRVDKDSRYWSSDGESRRRNGNSWLPAGIAGYGLAKVGRNLFPRKGDFDDTYSVRSGRVNESSSSLNRRSDRYSPDRKSRTSVSITQKPSENYGRHGRRSRSRSQNGRNHLAEAALGVAVGSSIAASSYRTRSRSPKKTIVRTQRRSREHSPASPSVLTSNKTENRRDERRSRYSPSFSQPESGPAGGFFDTPASRRRNSHGQKKKKQGFFSFGNASSSSSDVDLAFGKGIDRTQTRKQAKSQDRDHRKAEAALLGLGAAAAAMAANDSRKGRRKAEPVSVKEDREYRTKHDRASERKTKVKSSPSATSIGEDIWESASETDSVDSGLVYGVSRRRSQESLISDSSGTGKWGWRWGSKKKKRSSGKSGIYDSKAADAMAGMTAMAAGATLIADGHYHGSAMSSTTNLPPLQHVYPEPTSDPSRFDAVRQNSAGSFNQPLMASRPAPLPLQQPQPVVPLSSIVYATQAPLDHTYSAPTGPPVFSQMPHQTTKADVHGSAHTPFEAGQQMSSDGLPRAEIASTFTSRNATNGRKPRRRDTSPAPKTTEVESSSSGRRRRDTLRDDISVVRFDLTQDEDRDRTGRRKQEDIERREAEEQAEVERQQRRLIRKSEIVVGEQKIQKSQFDDEIQQGRNQAHESPTEKMGVRFIPAIVGIAGAAIGVAATKPDNVGLDESREERQEERRDTIETSNEISAATNQHAFKVDIAETRDNDEREVEFVSQKAMKSGIPYNHEDYAAYFTPLDLVSKSDDQKQVFDANADNDITSYQVPQVITIEPTEFRGASYSADSTLKSFGEGANPNFMALPWSVPRLQLIEPTPPPSVAGSSRGDASPTIRPEDAARTEADESFKAPETSDSLSDDPKISEYSTATPPERTEEPIKSDSMNHHVSVEEFEKAADATIKTRGTASPPSDFETRHIPGDFGDDLEFAATLAAGLQGSGFDPSIVIDDPTFRRRDSPAGSEQARVYKQPFSETVLDLGLDSPGTEGAPPQKAFIDGELPPTPEEDEIPIAPGNFEDDPKTKVGKRDKQRKDKSAKRQSKDEALSLSSGSSPPLGAEEVLGGADRFPAALKAIVTHNDNGSGDTDELTKPRKSEGKKSKWDSIKFDVSGAGSPLRSDVARDDFFDAPDGAATPSRNDIDQRLTMNEFQAKVAYLDDDNSHNVQPSRSRAEIDLEHEGKSERTSNPQELELYESPSDDMVSVAASAPAPTTLVKPKKSKKSSKRGTSDFDDVSSSVSAPTTHTDTKESKGKTKKDKKGGLFGLFGTSTNGGSVQNGSREIPTEATLDDFAEPKKKGKKSKNRRTTADIDDDFSQVNKSVPDLPELEDDERKAPRKSKKQERKQQSRDRSVSEDSGTATQKLPTKVYQPSSSGQIPKDEANISLTGPEDRNLAGIELESSFNDLDVVPHDKNIAQNTSENHLLSFLGERPKVPPPPNIDDPFISPSHEAYPSAHSLLPQGSFSKDTGDKLPTLPESRSTSPTAVGRVEDLPPLPISRSTSPLEMEPQQRQLSTLQLSEAPHSIATPSPTAVPLYFRKPPSSTNRSSPMTSPAASSQNAIVYTPRQRQSRPSSSEFKTSTEFRPLWLVERHASRQEPDIEETYPPLPASHSTSRSSSVHDADEEVLERGYKYHHDDADSSSPTGNRALTIDPSHNVAADFLDSQQATPTAVSFFETSIGSEDGVKHTSDESASGYGSQDSYGNSKTQSVPPAQEWLSRSEIESSKSDRVVSPVGHDMEYDTELPPLPQSQPLSPCNEPQEVDKLVLIKDIIAYTLPRGTALDTDPPPYQAQTVTQSDANLSLALNHDISMLDLEEKFLGKDGSLGGISSDRAAESDKKAGVLKDSAGFVEKVRPYGSPGLSSPAIGMREIPTVVVEQNKNDIIEESRENVDSGFTAALLKNTKKNKKNKKNSRGTRALDTPDEPQLLETSTLSKDEETSLAPEGKQETSSGLETAVRADGKMEDESFLDDLDKTVTEPSQSKDAIPRMLARGTPKEQVADIMIAAAEEAAGDRTPSEDNVFLEKSPEEDEWQGFTMTPKKAKKKKGKKIVEVHAEGNSWDTGVKDDSSISNADYPITEERMRQAEEISPVTKRSKKGKKGKKTPAISAIEELPVIGVETQTDPSIEPKQEPILDTSEIKPNSNDFRHVEQPIAISLPPPDRVQLPVDDDRDFLEPVPEELILHNGGGNVVFHEAQGEFDNREQTLGLLSETQGEQDREFESQGDLFAPDNSSLSHSQPVGEFTDASAQLHPSIQILEGHSYHSRTPESNSPLLPRLSSHPQLLAEAVPLPASDDLDLLEALPESPLTDSQHQEEDVIQELSRQPSEFDLASNARHLTDIYTGFNSEQPRNTVKSVEQEDGQGYFSFTQAKKGKKANKGKRSLPMTPLQDPENSSTETSQTLDASRDKEELPLESHFEALPEPSEQQNVADDWAIPGKKKGKKNKSKQNFVPKDQQIITLQESFKSPSKFQGFQDLQSTLPEASEGSMKAEDPMQEQDRLPELELSSSAIGPQLASITTAQEVTNMLNTESTSPVYQAEGGETEAVVPQMSELKPDAVLRMPDADDGWGSPTRKNDEKDKEPRAVGMRPVPSSQEVTREHTPESNRVVAVTNTADEVQNLLMDDATPIVASAAAGTSEEGMRFAEGVWDIPAYPKGAEASEQRVQKLNFGTSAPENAALEASGTEFAPVITVSDITTEIREDLTEEVNPWAPSTNLEDYDNMRQAIENSVTAELEETELAAPTKKRGKKGKKSKLQESSSSSLMSKEIIVDRSEPSRALNATDTVPEALDEVAQKQEADISELNNQELNTGHQPSILERAAEVEKDDWGVPTKKKGKKGKNLKKSIAIDHISEPSAAAPPQFGVELPEASIPLDETPREMVSKQSKKDKKGKKKAITRIGSENQDNLEITPSNLPASEELWAEESSGQLIKQSPRSSIVIDGHQPNLNSGLDLESHEDEPEIRAVFQKVADDKPTLDLASDPLMHERGEIQDVQSPQFGTDDFQSFVLKKSKKDKKKTKKAKTAASDDEAKTTLPQGTRSESLLERVEQSVQVSEDTTNDTAIQNVEIVEANDPEVYHNPGNEKVQTYAWDEQAADPTFQADKLEPVNLDVPTEQGGKLSKSEPFQDPSILLPSQESSSERSKGIQGGFEDNTSSKVIHESSLPLEETSFPPIEFEDEGQELKRSQHETVDEVLPFITDALSLQDSLTINNSYPPEQEGKQHNYNSVDMFTPTDDHETAVTLPINNDGSLGYKPFGKRMIASTDPVFGTASQSVAVSEQDDHSDYGLGVKERENITPVSSSRLAEHENNSFEPQMSPLVVQETISLASIDKKSPTDNEFVGFTAKGDKEYKIAQRQESDVTQALINNPGEITDPRDSQNPTPAPLAYQSQSTIEAQDIEFHEEPRPSLDESLSASRPLEFHGNEGVNYQKPSGVEDSLLAHEQLHEATSSTMYLKAVESSLDTEPHQSIPDISRKAEPEREIMSVLTTLPNDIVFDDQGSGFAVTKKSKEGKNKRRITSVDDNVSQSTSPQITAIMSGGDDQLSRSDDQTQFPSVQTGSTPDQLQAIAQKLFVSSDLGFSGYLPNTLEDQLKESWDMPSDKEGEKGERSKEQMSELDFKTLPSELHDATDPGPPQENTKHNTVSREITVDDPTAEMATNSCSSPPVKLDQLSNVFEEAFSTAPESQQLQERRSSNEKLSVATSAVGAGIAIIENMQPQGSKKVGKKNKKNRKTSSKRTDLEETPSRNSSSTGMSDRLDDGVQNYHEYHNKGENAKESQIYETHVPAQEPPAIESLSGYGQPSSNHDHKERINRDSAIHFSDSPTLPQSVPYHRNVRDSGYQGTEASPMFEADPDLIEETQDILPSSYEDNVISEIDRSSMASTAGNPLKISIEADQVYDISITKPPNAPGRSKSLSATSGDMKRSTIREDSIHQYPEPNPHFQHSDNLRQPSPVDSTTKDRSSVLFQSSPSTREDAIHISEDRGIPSRRDNQAQVTIITRDQGDDPGSPSSIHSEYNSRGRSLFGGPVGVNSDFESPSEIPRISDNSNRQTLSTITEHSPDESPLHKKFRAITDVGSSDGSIKAARRSVTPQIIAQHRVRSPLADRPVDMSLMSTDDIISRLSWPAVDEENHSVDLERSRNRDPDIDHQPSSRYANISTPANDHAKQRESDRRSISGASIRSGDSINAIIRTPEQIRSASGLSNVTSNTPPLRRVDRSVSSDLRAASKRDEANSTRKDPKIAEVESQTELGFGIPSSSTYDPVKDKGKARAGEMADVYVSLLEKSVLGIFQPFMSTNHLAILRRVGAMFTALRFRQLDLRACVGSRVYKS